MLGAKQGLYCSIACYAAGRRIPPTTVCLGCGQAFAAHRHGVHRRQKYCSLGCSRRRYRQTILDVLRANQQHRHPLIDAVGHQTKTSDPSCFTGSVLINKDTDIPRSAVDLDDDHPLPGLLVPGDVPVPGRGSDDTGPVLHVAEVRDDPQVASPVIESVAIDMIDLDAITEGQTKQFSVQSNLISSAVAMNRADGITDVAQLPPPTVYEGDVGYIDDRKGLDRAIPGAKGDTSRPITEDFNARGAPSAGASSTTWSGAIGSLPSDVASAPSKGCSTEVTGKIESHRVPPTLGVTPSADCTGARASSCKLYHPWLTLSDLAFHVYGDTRRSQIHAARTQLFRLRRCGYTFEHRDMALMGYRAWVRVYRLVGEPEAS